MSYQATILTNCLPSTLITLVDKPSTNDPNFLPKISDDTIGSNVISIVSDLLFLNNSLISSSVVFVLSSSVKSINDPSLTGTLIALPSSLPRSSGITNPIADAAPVDAGTIFAAHALPRLAYTSS